MTEKETANMILNSKKGFTVAEVVVAAAIFVGFMGAVFSLYSMGSRMYISGSWKYNKQKQAERFIQILKERVEQASDIVRIDSNINTKNTAFLSYKNGHKLPVSKSKTSVAAFVVAKPDRSAIIPKEKGIILFHYLYLEYNPATKLMDLCLEASTNQKLYKDCGGIFSLPTGWQADKNLIKKYGFGNDNTRHVLENVSEVTVLVNKSEIPNSTEMNVNYGLKIKMLESDKGKSSYECSCMFKIDQSVDYLESF